MWVKVDRAHPAGQLRIWVRCSECQEEYCYYNSDCASRSWLVVPHHSRWRGVVLETCPGSERRALPADILRGVAALIRNIQDQILETGENDAN